MARVIIVESLKNKILKKFKEESKIVFRLMKTLEESPRKGKLLGNVAGILIKELKYKSFRFYFISDGFKLKCLDKDDLIEVLIRFVRMSDKKSQQKIISGIKEILQKVGTKGFE